MTNKAMMITGAGQGIGRATALVFAKAGWDLALSDLNLDTVTETAQLCAAYGVKTDVAKVDVTQSVLVDALVRQTVDKLGTLNGLFNNAGVFYNAGPNGIHDMSDEQWDRMIAINLTAVFKVSRAVISYWVNASLPGAIVNSASVSASIAFTRSSHYCAAKAGVASFTRCTALEYGPMGIRCNSIAPGIIETSMTKPALSNPDTVADWMRRIPLKRLGQPEDVGEVVRWLISDESRYVTGDMVVVDGGWMLE